MTFRSLGIDDGWKEEGVKVMFGSKPEVQYRHRHRLLGVL